MPYTYPSPWAGFGQTPNNQSPVNGLVRVTGLEGAKAYQLPPNSAMPLFDGNEDTMYVKTTDGAGFPTIKKYSFFEEPVDISTNQRPVIQAQAQTETITEANYATKDEIDQLKKELDDAKQLISELKSRSGQQRPQRGTRNQKPDEG